MTIDELIAAARAGEPIELTDEERKAERAHQAYLERKAKDPDYWNRRHRAYRAVHREEYRAQSRAYYARYRQGLSGKGVARQVREEMESRQRS